MKKNNAKWFLAWILFLIPVRYSIESAFVFSFESSGMFIAVSMSVLLLLFVFGMVGYYSVIGE